jgi:hypothetical protein
MPQVYMILGPKASELRGLVQGLDGLGRCLIASVEEFLEIKGANDTAFTAVQALHTVHESDVQVEIRFTAGEDEYARGKPFELSLDDQDRLIEVVRMNFESYLHLVSLPKLSLSVWPKPYHGSRFKSFAK